MLQKITFSEKEVIEALVALPAVVALLYDGWKDHRKEFKLVANDHGRPWALFIDFGSEKSNENKENIESFNTWDGWDLEQQL